MLLFWPGSGWERSQHHHAGRTDNPGRSFLPRPSGSPHLRGRTAKETGCTPTSGTPHLRPTYNVLAFMASAVHQRVNGALWDGMPGVVRGLSAPAAIPEDNRATALHLLAHRSPAQGRALQGGPSRPPLPLSSRTGSQSALGLKRGSRAAERQVYSSPMAPSNQRRLGQRAGVEPGAKWQLQGCCPLPAAPLEPYARMPGLSTSSKLVSRNLHPPPGGCREQP